VGLTHLGYAPVMTDPTSDRTADGAPPTTSADPASAKDPLRRSRTSGTWGAVVGFALLLLVLVVFIAQNTQDVQVSFLWWDGRAPLAVSLLLASAVGILLAVVAGSLRIWQLRRRVRRSRA
jgi:uncharacterized integral membrane protein